MTGRVTRLLQRPVLWKAGFTLGEVLLIAAVVVAGSGALVVLLIAAVSRADP